jgi:hypothetical protein
MKITPITNINFSKFINKSALVETVHGTFFGTFGYFKDNMALYEGEFVKHIIQLEDIIKFICEDTKGLKNVGSMVSTENDENPHDEKKRTHDHTIKDNSRGKLIHENFSVLLRDRLKSKFFGNISEEVVNQENEFTMTEAEIAKRDRMADAMLNSSNFKPKLKGKDTKENAAHRIATFKIMGGGRKDSGYEPGLFSGGRDESAPKRTRSQRRDDARLTMGDKSEKKSDKKVLKSTRKKIANTNRTTGLSGSSKNVPKNRQQAEKQKASRKTVTDRKTFANLKGSDKLTLAAYRKRRLAKNLKSSRYSVSK